MSVVQLEKYRIKTISLSGKNNRVYKQGDVVRSDQLPVGQIDLLLRRGFIEPAGVDEATVDNRAQHLTGSHSNRIKSSLSLYEIKKIFSERITTETVMRAEEVKLSVIIPYFRAGYIGWLPLESLIRQVDVAFGWELVVMEEDFENPFGLKRILHYKDKLRQAGCCKIKYISISKWMPLSAKWYYLIKQTSVSSKVVAFNSADGYMSRKRLSAQYKVLSKGKYNWYKVAGNIVYDIQSDKHVKLINRDKKRTDTACRACTMDLAQRLPLDSIKRSVDGWTYRMLSAFGINYYYDDSDIWMDTVNVNGLNNITLDRSKRVQNVTPPMQVCCMGILNHVPKHVYNKLRQAVRDIGVHSAIGKNSNIKF
jgi:hypothetical protein